MGTTAFRPAANVKHAPTASEVAVTVEGRRARTLIVSIGISILAVAAFAAGRIAARSVEADGRAELALSDVAPNPQRIGEAQAGPLPSDAESRAPTVPLVIEPVETLRFLAFTEPTTLIDAETTIELNNSIGIDTTVLEGPEAAAVVADLVVIGPAGSSVAVHPGDRPADALRFTVPSSGRLLVPHLVASTDDDGRVVVSADRQVRVDMNGIGRYVPAASARAGRFVPTGSMRIGSLVTATDGRRLAIALPELLGADAGIIGQAVVRLNANVGQAGGSVSVGSGDPIPWPAPASQDLGLAGTELLTVEPNEDGEIIMDYLGGSVLTVDLVGYYTNAAAPDSTSGLLVLSPQPELRTFEAEDGDVAIDVDSTSVFSDGDGFATPALVTVEVTNGQTGGSVTFWNDRDPVPTSPAFALAPNQQRSTTEWLDPGKGSTTFVRAPKGASLRIWMLGAYT